ncbi:MAG: LPS assembly lipoprotein LptE [Longimicrobiales bacterium]|nr:LPS assembly lipoprotein LptE [Longimicrobiales bacterium]
MWDRFPPTSGGRRRDAARTPARGRRAAGAALLLAGAASGCLYGFNAGTGLDLRTVAILPFENQTTRLELTQEVHEILLDQLPRALGLNLAGEEVADAVVRGTIRDYSLRAPNFRPGAQQGARPEVLQRQVTLVVSVEVVDVARNLILWDNASVRTEGQFLEASEDEDVGKFEALELLVQRIVDGLQSNW